MPEIWIVFASLVVALLALDLGALRRKPVAVTRGKAVGWTVFWFVVGLAFNGAVYWAYSHHWRGLGMPTRHSPDGVPGEEASLQFLTAFLVELCLSLDNVFVMRAIFSHFRIPDELRQRTLTVGLLVSFLVRSLLVAGYSWLTASFTWSGYVLGVLLLLAAVRMVVIREKSLDPDANLVVRAIRYFFPLTESLEGENLMTRINGRLAFTRLATALLFIETADAVFAVESIPAAMAVARDPFLVLSANVLAVFAARSMYFAIADLVNWIRYVKIGLALVLAYTAVLMFRHFPITAEVSLIVMIVLVGAGVAMALLFARPGPAPTVSPLGEDADRVAKLALRQSAKIISLVVGLTVTIIGILMVPGPGPGLVVIPIGLAILAAEFVWARRLLQKYTETAQMLGKKAGATFIKHPRPWLIPLVIGAWVSVVAGAVLFTTLRHSVIASFGGGALIGQAIWGYLQMYRYRQIQAELKSRGVTPAAPILWPVYALIGVTLLAIPAVILIGHYELWKVAVTSTALLLGEIVCIAVIRAQIRGAAATNTATNLFNTPDAANESRRSDSAA